MARSALGLAAGLAGAVCVRLAVGGTAGVRSVSAGLVFAAALVLLASLGSTQLRAALPGRLLGGVVPATVVAAALCLVPVIGRVAAGGSGWSGAGWPSWAVVVTAVAVTEELLIRGALWDAVTPWAGERAALLVTTSAFALLHVPFYGIGVLLLDVAAGAALGGLRLVSGGWAAPALAHSLADLAGWWLR